MPRKGSLVRFAVVPMLLLATGVLLQSRTHSEVIPARAQLTSIPSSVGGYSGRDLLISQDVLDILGSGDFLSRMYYRGPSEAPIELFVAYFPSQRAGDTIHSPKNCLPGSGWTPLESSVVPLEIPGRYPIRANRYIIAKGSDRQLVMYWYQAHGRTVASEYWAKYYLLRDAITLNRTDGSLLRLITPMRRNEDLSVAQQRITDFARDLVPQLDPYIPN